MSHNLPRMPCVKSCEDDWVALTAKQMRAVRDNGNVQEVTRLMRRWPPRWLLIYAQVNPLDVVCKAVRDERFAEIEMFTGCVKKGTY